MKYLKSFIILIVFVLTVVMPLTVSAEEQGLAITNQATNVTNNSATLTGIVGVGSDVSYYFEWGTSTAYTGGTTPTEIVEDLDSDNYVSADISGLSPDTVYMYRLVVQDKFYTELDTFYGANQFFTTGIEIPVTTTSAINITTNSATLNGTVNPSGLSSVDFTFDWGRTTSYGSFTSPQSIGSGTTNINVSANISGLSPNTTYHYRVAGIVLENGQGISSGQDKTFTTLPPIPTTASPTNITTNSATLGGTVNPAGSIEVFFQWGETTAYEKGNTSAQSISGTNNVNVTANISGLSPNKTYNYRMVSRTSTGVSNGGNKTLTTTSTTTTTPTTTPTTTTTPPSDSMGRLVPCGGDTGDPCTFAHLMKLVHNIIRFLLFSVAMPVAAIAFVYAGFLFMFHGDNEAKRAQAKGIFLNVFFGLVIALAAWLIIDLILDTLLSSEKFRLLEQ